MERGDFSYLPVIYRGREHAEVALPLSAVLVDGKLDIIDEIKGKKYFQVYSRGAELVFQCGGFVGLIPINDRVAIEVAPRVNVSNLDRILQMAGAQHVLLSAICKFYAATEETGYLVDLLADALIVSVNEIIDWGKYKEYSRQTYAGHPRSGRILMKETFRLRAKNPGSVIATTARFERDSNNVINACIKLALERLLSLLHGSEKQAKSYVARISKLNISWLSFSEITYGGSIHTIVEEVERRLTHKDEWSEPYQDAIPLALAVLKGLGPSQRDLPPDFSLGSLIFDMADAFERYVRRFLNDRLPAAVLDGNIAGDSGAKSKLFTETNHDTARKNYATPDILIAHLTRRTNLAVLDVKYKTYQGIPEREDINQAVTYAVAYGCTVCGLVYLTKEKKGKAEYFGKIGNIEVIGLSISLGAADLLAEEERFSNDLAVLLGLVRQ